MRSLPPSGKNKTNSLVSWFYRDFLGYQADSSIYARHNNKKNPRAVCHLFAYDKEMDNAVYEPYQVGELIWYLVDSGVEVRDLGLVTMPGLLASYVNRKTSDAAKKDLERSIAYMRGEDVSFKKEPEFTAPSGW
jgi:hypothetical protein